MCTVGIHLKKEGKKDECMNGIRGLLKLVTPKNLYLFRQLLIRWTVIILRSFFFLLIHEFGFGFGRNKHENGRI